MHSSPSPLLSSPAGGSSRHQQQLPSSKKLVIILGIAGLALILLWLIVLSAAMNSILSSSSSSSASSVLLHNDKQHEHKADDHHLEEQQSPIHNEEDNTNNILVNEPITIDSIRKLKKRILELEDLVAAGGASNNNNKKGSSSSECDQLRKELIEAIQAERELQRELGRLRNENQKLVSSSAKTNNKNNEENPAPIVVQRKDDQEQNNEHHHVDVPVLSSNKNKNENNNQVVNYPAEKSGGRVIKGPGQDPSHDPHGTIPILLFTYNRAKLVSKLLQRIQELLMAGEQKSKRLPPFRVFVSQDLDGSHPDVTQVIQEAQTLTRRSLGIVYLMHNRDDSGATREEESNGWRSYYAISKHYAWAIAQTFSMNPNYQRIILLEEDLELAFDFFEYMAAMSPLFDKDPTLYCVSGFNDNGKAALVHDASAVYRSDFFPGLGWMMPRKLWDEELREKWPRGFWDDWMRQPVQRKGRSCVRPEIPRSKPTCQDGEGASMGQFCDDHLKMIVLNDPVRSRLVRWNTFNLQTLLPETYDAALKNEVGRAKTVYNMQSIFAATPNGNVDSTVVKLRYSSNEEFMVLAHALNIMDDFKDGVPRTAYHGIVTVKWRRNWAQALARNSINNNGNGDAQMIAIRDENPSDVRKVMLVSDRLLYVNTE